MAWHGCFALKLPVEIWRMVIISAVESLEPMDNCQEASASLTTRFHLARRVNSKSPEYTFMLVCKVLNAIATEFFYERLFIQSKGQLIALAEGLKSQSIANNMAKWTRRFDLHYAANTTVYNNRDKGLMARVLKSCPNLTHLVIEVAIHESKVAARAGDATVIIDACAKSCKRLELLHLAFNFTYMWAEMPLGVFLNAFRNIKILRQGRNAKMAIPRKAGVYLGELPFLHTFETSEDAHIFQFTDVSLPLLSTVHFPNVYYPYSFHRSAVLGFISVHGNKLTTLTLIGVAHEHPRYPRDVVALLLKCTRLQVFVTDVVDLVRLLPIDKLFLPQVTALELTNRYLPTRLPGRSDFRATIANVRAHFPSLEVIRWLGADQDESSSDTETDLDPLEDGTDAHPDHDAGIRIENRQGEVLELHELLIW